MLHSFRKLVFDGIVWSGISRFIKLGLQFFAMVFLARLLHPEDFGLISMALIFTLLGTLIVGFGLSFSVVQRKDLRQEQFLNCFWVCFLSGIAVCIITIFLAPFIGLFFHEQALVPVVQVLSLINILWGIRIFPVSILRRELNFKKIAMAEVYAMLAYGILSVTLALKNFGVWSLVWGNLASYLVSTLFMLRACSWKPTMSLGKSSIKELLPYSIKSMQSSILHYSGNNIDYLIVGHLLGPIALGFYSLVYNLITLPQRQLATIITEVSFPAFSRIQDDQERLKRGYLKNITYIALFSFPLLGGLAVAAPEFVKVVFGYKWIPAIVPLQILSLAGILYAVGAPINALLLAKGRADLDFKMTLLRLAMIAVFVFLGSRYGIVGVASAITIFAFVFIPAFQHIVNVLIKIKVKDYYKSIFAVLWSSVIMCLILFLYRYAIINFFYLGDLILLISVIIIGVLVYLLSLKVMKFDQWKELLVLMR